MNDCRSFILYVVLVSIATFVVYGVDKYKSQHQKWRIPESTLLLLAAIGGSVGAWCAMKFFHHKTLHKKFKYGIPLIIFLQIIALYFLFK